MIVQNPSLVNSSAGAAEAAGPATGRRVLLIAPQPFFASRGTPINVRELALVLGRLGHTVDLLVFPFGEDITIPGVRIIRSGRVPGVRGIPIGPSWQKLLLDLPLAARAFTLCRQERYDLIHGVEEGGFIAALLASIFRLPFIFDVDSDMIAQLRDRNIIRSRFILRSLARLERSVAQRAAAVLCVAPLLAERYNMLSRRPPVYCIEDFPLLEAELSTSDRHAVRERHNSASRKVFLYAGNLEEYQGVPLLLEAFAPVVCRCAALPPQLIIVGGERADVERIQTRAQELDIAHAVVLTGSIPQSNVATYLSASDILVSPRLRGENTPLKIYSYMASGKPIIASRIPAHLSVLTDHTAVLCEPTVEGFALALESALSSDAADSLRLRAAAAQRVVQEHYSRESFARRVQLLFEDLLPSHQRQQSTQDAAIAKRAPRCRLVLVTGANGFVGYHVVVQLRAAGYSVRALVRSRHGVDDLRRLGAEVVFGDIKDRSAISAALRDVEGVFHIAAAFREAKLPEREYFAVNVDAVRQLFEEAIAAGVKRVIHCSTVGVHGDVAAPPGTEESPYAPGDVYQRSKMEGEKVALEFLRSKRIAGAIIRPAMIFGPRDRRTLKLFQRISRERFFFVGRGDRCVHFVDVRDLAAAFVLAYEKSPTGEVYVIAGERALPLKNLTEMIAQECNVSPPHFQLPVSIMQLAGDICERLCRPFGIEPPIYRRRVDFFTKNRHFDSSKARRMLGFSPAQTLRDEIRDIILSYRRLGLLGAASTDQRITSFEAITEEAMPALMVRDLSGRITHWDSGAEARYGYEPHQVVGQVSHDVLSTEFPMPLDMINRQLQQAHRWEGELVHTTRDGAKVRVQSSWWTIADENRGEALVYEVNRPVSDKPLPPPRRPRNLRGIGTLAAPHALELGFSGTGFLLVAQAGAGKP